MERDTKEWKDLNIYVTHTSVKVDFGHNLKEYDCYGSECYLNYCKQAAVSAVEMAAGLRKVQKTYGTENTYLPTLEDYISSTISNGHSAANVSPKYMVSFFLVFYHTTVHSMNICPSRVLSHCLSPQYHRRLAIDIFNKYV